MTEALSNVLQMTAAAASVILMGVCGVCLCARLTRVQRGQENASGLTKEPFQIPLPFREMALAAAAAVLSRLALYALAYGFTERAAERSRLPGPLRRFGRTGMCAIIWALRRGMDIPASATSGFRLVFFPLYPAVTRVFSVFTGGRLFMAGTLVSLLASGVCAARFTIWRICTLGGAGAAGGRVFPAQPDERVSRVRIYGSAVHQR